MVLSDCMAWEQRERALNMPTIMDLIMALSLFPQHNAVKVLREMTKGIRYVWDDPQVKLPTKGAISTRRKQLQVLPMHSSSGAVADRWPPQPRVALLFCDDAHGARWHLCRMWRMSPKRCCTLVDQQQSLAEPLPSDASRLESACIYKNTRKYDNMSNEIKKEQARPDTE